MFGFILPIGMAEMILILIVVLMIFGPGKLPEIGKMLGSGIREFKSSMDKRHNDDQDEKRG